MTIPRVEALIVRKKRHQDPKNNAKTLENGAKIAIFFVRLDQLKNMRFLISLALLLVFLSPTQRIHAQMQGASGLNSVILKLFGKHDDFTVDADFELKKAQITLTMTISVSGGKLRADADMSTYRGAGINKDMKEQIKLSKAAGLDRIISITRPDQNRLYRIFPGRKSYEEAPVPKEAAGVNGISKIKKTPLARETLDGHPCLKVKVALVDDKGRQQEMTVWEATDLKDFPIMVQLSEGGENMVVHNRNIRFGKPLPSLFELPVGYAKTRLTQ
jgi:hypothetical protein